MQAVLSKETVEDAWIYAVNYIPIMPERGFQSTIWTFDLRMLVSVGFFIHDRFKPQSARA
jgi:hypothetical protein